MRYLAGIIFLLLYLFLVYYVGKGLETVVFGEGHARNRNGRRAFLAAYLLLHLAVFLTALLPEGVAKRILYTAGVWFLGGFTYLLLLYLLSDLVFFITGKVSGVVRGKGREKSGEAGGKAQRGGVQGLFSGGGKDAARRRLLTWMTLLATGITLYGGFHAKDIRTVRYDVRIEKSGGPMSTLNVVMVSDIHLGYIVGPEDVERMTQAIGALEPDLVVLAGDIFDDNLNAVRDQERIRALLLSLESTYGTFAALGNHDAGRTYPGMVSFLEESGVIVLQDEGVLVGDAFFLAGRKDYRPIGNQGEKRKPLGEYLTDVDRTRPFIMIDHQPVALDEAEAHGVDLLLSGHSHKGQIHPGMAITRRIYQNDWGYLRVGGMHSVVSSGFGTWGPPLRVGTDSEVVQVMVELMP